MSVDSLKRLGIEDAGDGETSAGLEVLGDNAGLGERFFSSEEDATGAAVLERLGENGAAAFTIAVDPGFLEGTPQAPTSADLVELAAVDAGEDGPAAGVAENLRRPQHWTDARWNRWLAHVRINVARKETKKPVSRPLYPDKVAQRDSELVLKSIGAFIYHYGFWPTAQEIATGLRAHYGAVVFYLFALQEDGMVRREWIGSANKNRAKHWVLTVAAWEALGIPPIEPWNPHPRTRLKRVAHKVAIDLHDMERAERAKKGT